MPELDQGQSQTNATPKRRQTRRAAAKPEVQETPEGLKLMGIVAPEVSQEPHDVDIPDDAKKFSGGKDADAEAPTDDPGIVVSQLPIPL